MTRRSAVLILTLCIGPLVRPADAADLLLRTQPQADVAAVCGRYGWVVASETPNQHLYLVQAPDSTTQAALDGILATDRDIQGLEFSVQVQAPAVPGGASFEQAVAGLLTQYQIDFIDYYGGPAWDYYVTQGAAEQLRLNEAHQLATGAGIIAIIDTGVDPTHPALQNALVEGYDFTRDLQGYGSEWNDVALNQSVAWILEDYFYVTLNQSVAWILEGGSAPPPPLPPYFGHGTMVAGIVHLAAPTSKIMPLKAFKADGSTSLYNILRAIYYAVDHGAKVINMSFASFQPSRELSQALSYAAREGVVAIAAVGNNGLSTDTYPVYPADYRVSFGIASTQGNKRSVFSNYGGDVKVGAPGEALLTTFPGGIYAAVWGTSFSAGWASGSIGLFLERSASVTSRDVDTAFSDGAIKLRSSEKMGAGRLDVYKALTSVPVR
jgi:subtilisin family serine protease